MQPSPRAGTGISGLKEGIWYTQSWGRGLGLYRSVLGSKRSFFTGVESGKSPDVHLQRTGRPCGGPYRGTSFSPRRAWSWLGGHVGGPRPPCCHGKKLHTGGCALSDSVYGKQPEQEICRAGPGSGAEAQTSSAARPVGSRALLGAVGREQVLPLGAITQGVRDTAQSPALSGLLPGQESLVTPGVCHPCLGLAMGTGLSWLQRAHEGWEARCAAEDGRAA